jgi:hypothetical protein
VDEYRLDHLAQVVTWYFEDNLSPPNPLQMAQCFSNAWVSRGPPVPPTVPSPRHSWGTAVYQGVRAIISLSLGDVAVTDAETASSVMASPLG